MEPQTKTFHCACCGACCRWPGFVRVDDEQIARISNFLKISENDFIDQYTRLATDRSGLILADAPDGACCFLSPDNHCQIQPVKPTQCQNFPLTWKVPPEFQRLCQGRWT